MALPPETRASLLLRIQDPEDVEAWIEFQDIYRPLVYRLGRSRGLQDADAHELAQDVMIAVAGAIERWEPDRQRSRFRTWLYRVARNTLINQLAQQNRREQATGNTDVQRLLLQVTARDDGQTLELQQDLRRQTFLWAAAQARRSCKPATWEAFWQTCVEGRTVAEVASQLKMTPGAVYVCRSRVMAKLRQLVEQVSSE
jgi:RNA polymerase sigma-70 factor (ECF subfamily)